MFLSTVCWFNRQRCRNENFLAIGKNWDKELMRNIFGLLEVELLYICSIFDLYFISVFQVLKNEFPRGIDIIYESVGGHMFDLCLNALAVYGRLIVIGMISQVFLYLYTFLANVSTVFFLFFFCLIAFDCFIWSQYQGEHGWKPSNYTGLCEKILAKSQTVVCSKIIQNVSFFLFLFFVFTDYVSSFNPTSPCIKNNWTLKPSESTLRKVRRKAFLELQFHSYTLSIFLPGWILFGPIQSLLATAFG